MTPTQLKTSLYRSSDISSKISGNPDGVPENGATVLSLAVVKACHYNHYSNKSPTDFELFTMVCEFKFFFVDLIQK